MPFAVVEIEVKTWNSLLKGYVKSTKTIEVELLPLETLKEVTERVMREKVGR